MQLIKQRGDFDCGVAVMAMLLGIDYDQAVDHLGRDVAEPNAGVQEGKPSGVWPDEIATIAWRRGRPASAFRTAEYFSICAPAMWNGQRGAFAICSSADLVDYILPGRRACLVVPSLNVDGHAHWIAWDGAAVFDPSPKRTYQDLDGVVIAEAVVLA
jgi:hypothetical protein